MAANKETEMDQQDSLYFDIDETGEDNVTDGRYFDWSTTVLDTVMFEAHDGTSTALLRLSWNEVAALHHQLTLTLLARIKQS